MSGEREPGDNSKSPSVYDRVRSIIGISQEANPHMISKIKDFLEVQNVPYMEARPFGGIIRKAEKTLPLGNHKIHVENTFVRDKGANHPIEHSTYTLYSKSKDKPVISLSYRDTATVVDIAGILGPSEIFGSDSLYFRYFDEIRAAGLNNIDHAMILDSLQEAVKVGENSIFWEAVMAPALRLDEISDLNHRYLSSAHIEYE